MAFSEETDVRNSSLCVARVPSAMNTVLSEGPVLFLRRVFSPGNASVWPSTHDVTRSHSLTQQ